MLYLPAVPLSCAICAYNGKPLCAAAALATARDTAKIAFAPNTSLFSVPSKSIIAASIALWSVASMPFRRSVMGPKIPATAFKTPLPRYLALSPSRSSNASLEPVEAPEGAQAEPKAPPAKSTSASTVGLPRESNTSRALMSAINWSKIYSCKNSVK